MNTLTWPLDALVSYWYWDDDAMARIAGCPRLRLVGDSGAFSAHSQGGAVTLPGYAAWCTRWAPHLAWVAALDVIGDAPATRANWAELRDRYGITSVPTLHAGAAPELLDGYAAEGCDLIGLGGLVGVTIACLPWIVAVFRYARDRHPQVRFHLWGVSHRPVLTSVPAWSADAAGKRASGAFRYATLVLFDPATGRDRTIFLDGHSPYRHRRLLAAYDVAPEAIARSGPGNRTLLTQLTASSVQQYAGWLTARRSVPPPPSLPGQPSGPRIHIADMPGDLERRAGIGAAS